MAFSKKNKRKITVGGNDFFWSATGNDGWISLCIMTEIQGSPRLSCKFCYHHAHIETPYGEASVGQFVITPYIAGQVIEYALSIGWKPFEKGKDLDLHHIDDKIHLRIDKNRIIDEKKLDLIQSKICEQN